MVTRSVNGLNTRGVFCRDWQIPISSVDTSWHWWMTLRCARIFNMLAAALTARSLHRGAVLRGVRGRATPVKRSNTNLVSTDGESGLHGVRLTFTQLHSQLYELYCTCTHDTWTNERAKKQRNITRRFRPTCWNPHATGLHISDVVYMGPYADCLREAVEGASGALIKPPALGVIVNISASATIVLVVVAVFSRKSHPLGGPTVI